MLKTARVLVIDDVAEEAMPMIHALGQIGIGSIHVSGIRREELPAKPYRGIRLAFVDMDLDVGGGQVKQIVSKAVAVFKRVVAEDTGPCVIVAWTKHPDYVDAFRAALAVEMPHLVPGLITNMEKPAVAAGIKVADIVRDISAFLKEHWPLNVLWSLEQVAHEAVTDTSQLICRVAASQCSLGPEDAEWRDGLARALGSLVRASGGSAVVPSATGASLIETMGSLHLDSMEDHLDELPAAGLADLATQKQLDGNGKIQFNTCLACSSSPDDDELRPGNVYLCKWSVVSAAKSTPISMKPASVLADFSFNWRKDAQYRKLWSRVQSLQSTPSQKDEISAANVAMEARGHELRKLLLENSRCALVEVTPACDYAQGKRRMARFLGGLWVPESMMGFLDLGRAPYYMPHKPMRAGRFKEPYCLSLNAHFLYSLDLCRKVSRKPAFRLRQSVVAEIQHWLLTLAARPGSVAVD